MIQLGSTYIKKPFLLRVSGTDIGDNFFVGTEALLCWAEDR